MHNQLTLKPLPSLIDLMSSFYIFCLLEKEEISKMLKQVWATGR